MAEFLKKHFKIFILMFVFGSVLMIGWRYWQDRKNHMDAYLDMIDKIETANRTTEEVSKGLSSEEVEWAYVLAEAWKNNDEETIVDFELNGREAVWELAQKLLADEGIYVYDTYTYRDAVAVLEPTDFTIEMIYTGIPAGLLLAIGVMVCWYGVRWQKYDKCA